MASAANRRTFLRTAGVGLATTAAWGAAATAAGSASNAKLKIIAISGSPRPGKTTAAALQIALEAAQAVDPERIEVELIELAGMKMNGDMAAGLPLEAGQRDDFPTVAAKLVEPNVAGILIGSPVYLRNMTSLCKAFVDRAASFRGKGYLLSNKVGGALAVGAVRNGGQELTIEAIHSAMYCQEMIVVGDARPTAHAGAALWNNSQDDIEQDEMGIAVAKNLGRRVAEVALKIAGAE
jgi:multimeric flavodoxin WrbA